MRERESTVQLDSEREKEREGERERGMGVRDEWNVVQQRGLDAGEGWGFETVYKRVRFRQLSVS